MRGELNKFFAMTAAFCDGLATLDSEPGYVANYEPVKMKGMSAEQMGTANKRNKNKKRRRR